MVTNIKAGVDITANDLASKTMSKIIQKTKSVGRQFQVVGKNITDVGNNFKNIFPQLSTIIIGNIVKNLVGQTKSLINSTAEYGDKIVALSEKTGFGTKALQEYSYAARFSNMTSEDFTNSIEVMNKSMGQLRAGGGALVSNLKSISPVLLEQIKNAKDNEEAFGLMIKAIQDIEDPAKKVHLATTFFGKAGTNMIHLANQGVNGLIKLKEEANKTGNVLGNDFFDDTVNFNNSMQTMKENIGGIGKTIGSKLMPVMIPIINQISEWIMLNQKFIKQKIADYVEKFSKWINSINFKKVFKSIEKLINGLSWFIGAITSSKLAISSFLVIMNSGFIVSILKLTGSLLTLGKIILPIITTGLKTITTILIANPIGAFITAIAIAGLLIYKYWEPIGKFFSDLWEGIKNTFSNAWEWIKDSIASIGDWIKNSAIVKSISSLVSNIGSIFSKKNKLDLETNVNENRNLIVGKNNQDNFSENENNLKSVSKNNYGSNFSAMPQSKSELIVKFDNMPRGISVNSVKESNSMDLGVEMGYALSSGII